MTLEPYNQTDNTCKLRPDQGIDVSCTFEYLLNNYHKSIMELQPGLITGPLSSIFKELIHHLAKDFDYDTNSMFAVPVNISTLNYL